MFTNLTTDEQEQTISQTTTFDSIDLIEKGDYVKGFGVSIAATLDTPAAKTFDSGVAEIATATFPTAGAKASGTVTITNYANLVSGTDDSIEIAGVVFVAQAGAVTPGDATFQAVTDNDTTAASLMAQVNAHATTAAIVIASRVNAIVTITALAKGVAGNFYTLVYTDNDVNVGATVSGATFTGGVAAVMTAGDYIVIYDTAGLGWAVAADMGGSAAPTGAIWTSIAAARKAQVDLSGNLTAAQVAAAFELSFDALASVPFATDDTAADGTMIFTMTLRGACTNAVTKSYNDAGAGSISVVTGTAGVNSEVDVTANTLTIPTHGYTVGLKGQLTTTGTLPTGLSLATDYFVIVVDANTIKLANSLVNANAGTAVDITDQGVSASVNTFTSTALAGANYKVQGSVDNVYFVDLDAAVNITATANFLVQKVDPMYRYIRSVYTMTAGQLIINQIVLITGQ